jgi:hypothetical protein
MAVKTTIQTAGEFELELAEIISVGETTVDVTAEVIEVVIYEDTQNVVLSGSLVFKDNFNLPNIMPLLGQEILRLKLSTPSFQNFPEVIDFTEQVFFIHEIETSVPVGDMNQVHLINFISMEAMINQRKKISKTLKGTYADIVKSILRGELESTKDLYIEPSSGIKQMIGPNWHPFDIIEQAKRESVSEEHKSPTYLFYETMLGFHFRSLESLYTAPTTAYYTTSSQGGLNVQKGGQQDIMGEFAKMLDYNIDQKPDTLLNSSSGVYGSTLITHDIFNKTFTTSTYNYLDAFPNEKHINSFHGKPANPMFSAVALDDDKKRISDFPTKTYMLPVSIKDTVEHTDANFVTSIGTYPYAAYNPSKWLQRRDSQMTQLDGGFVVTITVNGNTALHAGEIVELELPYSAMQKSAENETVDRFFRGPFMIRNLQHIFDNIERTHKIIMTLVKDCVEKKLEASDDNIVPKVNMRGINFDQRHDFYHNYSDD